MVTRSKARRARRLAKQQEEQGGAPFTPTLAVTRSRSVTPVKEMPCASSSSLPLTSTPVCSTTSLGQACMDDYPLISTLVGKAGMDDDPLLLTAVCSTTLEGNDGMESNLVVVSSSGDEQSNNSTQPSTIDENPIALRKDRPNRLDDEISYIQELAKEGLAHKVWHELRKLSSHLVVLGKYELRFTVVGKSKQPGQVTVSADGSLGVPGWLVPWAGEVEEGSNDSSSVLSESDADKAYNALVQAGGFNVSWVSLAKAYEIFEGGDVL